jgi:hypothetical protein
MGKNASPARQMRGPQARGASAFPYFKVTNLRQVSWGKIRWLCDVEVGPITLLDCRVVAPDGQPLFVAVAKIKDARSQTYRSTADVNPAFMRMVFDTVVASLNGTTQSGTPPAAENSWAQEQEARFERAFAELGQA